MTAHYKRRVVELAPDWTNHDGVDGRDWQRLAACRGHIDDGTLFPTTLKGSGADLRRREATERANRMYCNHCPVRARCHQLGQEIAAEWGIWGGVNFDQPYEQKIRNRQERRA